MKIAAIDVGSNSVRLMMWADGKTLYKRLNTTRLGEGLNRSGAMLPEAIERTAVAVKEFVGIAERDGADKVYAFATAAVRSSSNKQIFINRVKQTAGIDVEVISGEREAEIGILGALGNKDGGIIDVGGASTEITVRNGGRTLYSHSLNLGTVRLYDAAGRDYKKLEKVIEERIAEYGEVPCEGAEMFGIGGTATTIASVYLGLKVYDPNCIQGCKVPASAVKRMAEDFTTLSVESIKKVDGMEPRRADLIGGGCLLTYKIMKKTGLDSITVSESDNLEGYVIAKVGANEK